MTRARVIIPFVWLALFILLPVLIAFKIGLAEMRVGAPPYTNDISLANFQLLLEDQLYWRAYLGSVQIALVSTFFALLIGYPMAYTVARAPAKWRTPLLLLVMLPFWTSFLIRVYAWIGFLRPGGILNSALIGLGVIDEPLRLLNTPFAVYVGMVFCYLPFMVLPLYARLEKLDPALLEAAADLGATPTRTFLRVTLPLSLPGIIVGCLLVFIPAVGEFVIPEMLGGADTLMIGRVLWNEFFTNRDWPLSAAVSIVLLLVLVLPIAAAQTLMAREEPAG